MKEVVPRDLTRRLLLPMVIAVLVYGALLLYADAEALLRNITRIPGSVILIAAGLASSNFVIRFLRWQYYLHRLGIKVPALDSAIAFVSAFAMSITPGKMGELIKSILLKQDHDVPISRSAPIVVAERTTDLSALIILGAIGLLEVPGGFWPALLSFVGVLVVVALCSSRRLSNLAVDFATKLPFLSKRSQKLRTLQNSMLELNQPVPFFIGLILALGAWGAQCFGLNVIAWSFPNVTLSVMEGLLTYSAPLVAGTLALIPGGLGLTEGTMTGALQTFGGEGATESVAAAITILCRLTTFWFAVVLGFTALALWRVRSQAKMKTR